MEVSEFFTKNTLWLSKCTFPTDSRHFGCTLPCLLLLLEIIKLNIKKKSKKKVNSKQQIRKFASDIDERRCFDMGR